MTTMKVDNLVRNDRRMGTPERSLHARIVWSISPEGFESVRSFVSCSELADARIRADVSVDRVRVVLEWRCGASHDAGWDQCELLRAEGDEVLFTADDGANVVCVDVPGKEWASTLLRRAGDPIPVGGSMWDLLYVRMECVGRGVPGLRAACIERGHTIE